MAQIHAALAYYYENQANAGCGDGSASRRCGRVIGGSVGSRVSQAVVELETARLSISLYMDVHIPRAVTTALRIGVEHQRSGENFSGIIYARQQRITIGQFVEDLELLAKATEPAEWTQRIE